MGEPTRRAMAVEAAREVFWARGYEDASIADIIEASGLNRYAIYAEFEGKRELFLACLADFVAERRARIAPILFDAERPPLARLRRAFHMMIDEMLSDRRGCLMSQTAIEVARDDPVIRDTVRVYFEEVVQNLAAPLREAAAEGRLNRSLSPEMGAQLLFNLKIALSVLARAGAARDALEATVETTLSALAERDQDPHQDRHTTMPDHASKPGPLKH